MLEVRALLSDTVTSAHLQARQNSEVAVAGAAAARTALQHTPFPRGREAALDGHVLSPVTVLSDDRNDRPTSETETVLSETKTVLSDDCSLQLRCIGVQLNRT